jgi:hypothetical protein
MDCDDEPVRGELLAVDKEPDIDKVAAESHLGPML